MNNIVCPECRGKDAVLDYAAGDVICAHCGLVIDSHYIDDTPEWRTFSNEGETADRSRIGECYNSLLPDGGISTTIAATSARGEEVSSLMRLANRLPTVPGDSSKILAASKRCATMAGRLSLVFSVQCRANEIFQKLHSLNFTKGKNQDAILASCIYIACRQEDKPRTIKEVCSIAEGITKKELGRIILAIVKLLEQETGVGIQAQDFMRRFCGNLALKYDATRAATEVMKSAERGLDIRRSPMSIAAAAIFMVLQLQEVDSSKPSLEEISEVCAVSTATIWETYILLLPDASKLIPGWFCPAERARDLPSSKPRKPRAQKSSDGQLKRTANLLLPPP